MHGGVVFMHCTYNRNCTPCKKRYCWKHLQIQRSCAEIQSAAN